jgi:hypothetical protein
VGIRLHVFAAFGALLVPLVGGCATALRTDGDDPMGGADEQLEVFTFLPPLLPFLVPPHVDGDREFEGHGPDMTVTIDLHIVDGDRIHATVHIEAAETRWDWTLASGSADFLLYQAQDPIHSIDSPAHFEHRYRDTDHARDVFEFPEGDSLVKKLTCIGDTMGREAGTKTGCSAELHPITVTLDEKG